MEWRRWPAVCLLRVEVGVEWGLGLGVGETSLLHDLVLVNEAGHLLLQSLCHVLGWSRRDEVLFS